MRRSLLNPMRKYLKKVKKLLYGEIVSPTLKIQQQILLDEYLQNHLYNNQKYHQTGKLNLFEYQSFSQHGEDGIIEEIFKRIGLTNSYFVEFGVGDGNENNTAYLLYKGWSGCWIEGNQDQVNSICQNLSNLILSKQLKVLCKFINSENIESLLLSAAVPAEFDLLSIDIDRNDYYVWEAIKAYKPRVVVIEYNAIFRPGCEFIIPYNASAIWDGTSNFGASLDSLYLLGLNKGYKLVACNFSGSNAFFVREDLVAEKFAEPFTPINHYEPPRYFLSSLKSGHKRKIIL